jgi:hypothetical protein
VTWHFADNPDKELSNPWSAVSWPKPDKQEWYDFPFLALGKTNDDWDFDDMAAAQKCALRMTREQFLLLAVLNVDGEICNGGVSQMLFNSYGQLAEEAIEGFRLFGFERQAELVDEALTLFDIRPISRDRATRIARLDVLSGDVPEPEGFVENPATGLGEGRSAIDPNTIEGAFQIFSATAERWESIQTEYFALLHAKTHGPGYNSAYWRPLAEWIADHRDRFFTD